LAWHKSNLVLKGKGQNEIHRMYFRIIRHAALYFCYTFSFDTGLPNKLKNYKVLLPIMYNLESW